MIVLFTDFGVEGPYVGQMKSVLKSLVPESSVIDLMHDAPTFNPQASAYLLAALTSYLPEQAVVVGVIDPEVGQIGRRPCIVKADQRWFIGPDNGLFNVLAKRATTISMWEIIWRPEHMSNTFHGRDLFAPVAAMIACGDMPESVVIDLDNHRYSDWHDDLAQIIYIDHYGNCMTGLRAEKLASGVQLKVGETILVCATTFSDVSPGEGFYYENSIGLIEIAVNQGRASEMMNIKLGDSVSVIN